MTTKYDNVYLKDASSIAGPFEKKGPLGAKFDITYEDFKMKEKSWEKAEVKMFSQSIELLLKKTKLKQDNIDLIIAGDLLNQITSSCYGIEKFKIPFLGIYGACSTINEGIIIGSNFIEQNKKNIIVSTASHNMSSEKQFRNPTEYGAPKPSTATFTATGAVSILLTNEKTNIKIESSTIGKIVNMKQTDVFNMGAIMAPAAGDTLQKHLKDLNREPTYYDLILTGDLGKYGKEILVELMKTDCGIDISNNYNDCGVMLYDLKKQRRDIKAGGSGPVCSALVTFGYIMKEMRKHKYKKVLLIATGALFSPTFAYQHQDILAIAHAVSLEVI